MRGGIRNAHAGQGAFCPRDVADVKVRPHVADRAWDVRDTDNAPLSEAENNQLWLLVDEWIHAKFI